MTEDKSPSLEDKDKKVAPSDGDGEDKAGSKSQAHSNDIPEKLAGKSTEDLVKMYGELERKFGEQSHTVAEAKQLKRNQELLAQAIYSDPDLTAKVEKQLKKLTGDDSDSSTDKKESVEDSRLTDLRRSHENRIISDFSKDFGFDDLKPEEKQSALKKVGKELADLIDPSGKKSMADVLSSVSLERLPKLLEKAYFLSNMDKITSSDPKDMADFASIGRFSSSSSKGDSSNSKLSDSELAVAKKLGVSPEKYLESKKKQAG